MEVVRREPFGGPRVGDRGVSTQRAILDAALLVFRQHGFHGTKVELITEAAGCSRPSFYQYFSSKEEVYWHLARELSRKMADVGTTIEASTPDSDGVKATARWIDRLVDLQSVYSSIIDSFPAAIREPTEQYSASRRSTVRLGHAIIASAPVGQHLDAFDALPTVAATVALRTIHFWDLGLAPMPRRRFVTGLARTVHRVLHGTIDGVNTSTPGSVARAVRPMPNFPRRDDLPVPARARGRDTRDQLIDAATRTLARVGYHDARIDDIVAEAGISHGSFYRYFASKEDVFGVLAERAATAMYDLAAVASAAESSGSIETWLITYFDLYRDNGGIISAWQEVGYDESPFHGFALGVAAAVFDRIRMSFSEIGSDLSPVDGLAVLSVIERVPYLVFTLDTIDEDEAIEATAHFVRRAFFR